MAEQMSRRAKSGAVSNNEGSLGKLTPQGLSKLGRYLAARALCDAGYAVVAAERNRLRASKPNRVRVLGVVPRHKYTGENKLKRSYKAPKTKHWVVVDIDGSKYSVYCGTREQLEGRKTRIPMRPDKLQQYERLVRDRKISDSLKLPAEDLEPPGEIRGSLERFKGKYPDASQVAFIMLQFGNFAARDSTEASIREAFRELDISACSAVPRQYHPDLYWNVITYCYGCGLGVAVFEKSAKYDQNPNIALEVGYMMALGRPVLLLKDQGLKRLQADLSGKLYKTFNPREPKTIRSAVTEWSRELGLRLPSLSQVLSAKPKELAKLLERF